MESGINADLVVEKWDRTGTKVLVKCEGRANQFADQINLVCLTSISIGLFQVHWHCNVKRWMTCVKNA